MWSTFARRGAGMGPRDKRRRRGLTGQAEHELGDDVALDLRRAAPDGLGPRPQERLLQVGDVETVAADLVGKAGDVGEELTDVLVRLTPLQLRHARRRTELLALLDLREHRQRVVAQALEL